MAPVIRAIDARPGLSSLNVSSSQHTDLLRPLLRDFAIRVDHDLQVMRPNQTLSGLHARVLTAIDPILISEKPDAVLVQGDTTTALAGAMAAFNRGIPVGHVEAGLRSGDALSPFPEEMNRRLITQVASWHYAATRRNRDTLLKEGVDPGCVFLTGNPVTDAVADMAVRAVPSPETAAVLNATAPFKRILLTTHRRESFGTTMRENLQVLRAFVESHPNVALIFPVHPNPSVRGPAEEVLGDVPRVHLTAPLDYEQFVAVMRQTWLIVSDSGGVQEEAPSLGVPLLILRDNTERPEAVESGCAKLVGGGGPGRLATLLDEVYAPNSWAAKVAAVRNPFGDGHAAEHIAAALAASLVKAAEPELAVSV